jgi:hypothetical protein
LIKALGLKSGRDVVSNTIQEHLSVIETRLSETLESFAVQKVINEKCNEIDDAKLYEIINKRVAFWQALLLAHQTTQFLGINSLLDKNSSDSATLYSVLKALEISRPGVVPIGLENDLDAIRSKYAKFRHKLFGHNDKKRQDVVNQFNNAGFTWQSQASDLEKLEYAFKVLFEANSGRPIPSQIVAQKMKFPYQISVERTTRDTESVLADLRA